MLFTTVEDILCEIILIKVGNNFVRFYLYWDHKNKNSPKQMHFPYYKLANERLPYLIIIMYKHVFSV